MANVGIRVDLVIAFAITAGLTLGSILALLLMAAMQMH